MSPSRFFSEDEKRHFLRMLVESPIELADRGGSRHQGLCINLSANGLLVESDTLLAPGEHLEVMLPSPRTSLSGLRARVEVIRVEAGSQRKHRLGLHVIELLD